MPRIWPAALLLLTTSGAGCASLEQLRALVRAPVFEEVEGQPAEVRLLAPGPGRPLGGAAVRLWTKVTNPNPFGLTLGTLAGTLSLDGNRAAEADFPLGLPLTAGQAREIPIDLTISFSDLPALADALRRAGSSQSLPYALDGTIGVDAGRLGQPVFGPMTLVRGDLRVR